MSFDSLQELAESEFVEHIMRNTRSYMKDLKETIVSGLQVCDCEDGPYMYRETLEADLQNIEKINSAEDFLEMSTLISKVKWARLATNRDKSVSEELAAYVKGVREEVKKTVASVVEQYFFDAPEELYQDMLSAKSNMEVLAQLVNDFADTFAEKKTGKNND